MVSTQFWILAGVAIIVVLAAVLYPVFKTQAKVALALLVLSGVTTALLYTQVGTPEALDARLTRQPTSLKDAIFQLEHALQRDPKQAEGWALLAQSYRQDGQFEKSRDAFAKAVALDTTSPALLTDAAEARAMAHAQHLFDPQAVALLQQALKLDTRNERARWFMGVALRQQHKDAEAAEIWAELLPRVAPAAADALLPQINEARAAAGLAPMTMPARAEGEGVAVHVTIDAALAKDPRVTPASTVFIIARVPGGPPMPVAARKLAVVELPATITLTDADSPMPTAKLGSLKNVEVFARLSFSGSANREPSDVESAIRQSTVPAKTPVELALGTK